MRVGTRITATISVIVAVTLGGYAFFSLRGVARERRAQLESHARDLAGSVRAVIEGEGVDAVLAHGGSIAESLGKSGSRWHIEVLDASLVALDPRPPEQALQIARLDKLLKVKPVELSTQVGGVYYYMLPLRVPDPGSADGFEIIGAVEVSRNVRYLDAARRDDLLSAVTTLGLIAAVLMLVIVLSVRLLVVQPIEKLIAGIDDVAHGDLSRVLLAERDDEVGALASRFNEMTFSLRESQAETARHTAARQGLEQRLFHTEKMASIGQLAAEIAHEVGTPLNVISGRARSLARKSAGNEVVERNANIIAEQADRIARIVQRLLDFTRKRIGAGEMQSVNLNEITFTTMEFLESQFAHANVSTKLARAEGLPLVRGNADELQQVFLNLFLNAAQAMPGGGTLRVETSAVERRRPGLESEPDSRFVKVVVADTGVGIPEDKRDKIFDAFYTSKEREGGTGLGLAVCHGIVKEHDGFIEISDNPGGGTVFSVFLPAAAG